jgi:hypothetical protein
LRARRWTESNGSWVGPRGCEVYGSEVEGLGANSLCAGSIGGISFSIVMVPGTFKLNKRTRRSRLRDDIGGRFENNNLVASALRPFVGRFGDQQIHMSSRTRTGSDSCRLSPPRLLRNFLGTGISKSTRRRFNSTSVSRPKLTLTEHRTSRLRAMPAAVPDSLVRLSRARSRRRTEPSSMSS